VLYRGSIPPAMDPRIRQLNDAMDRFSAAVRAGRLAIHVPPAMCDDCRPVRRTRRRQYHRRDTSCLAHSRPTTEMIMGDTNMTHHQPNFTTRTSRIDRCWYGCWCGCCPLPV